MSLSYNHEYTDPWGAPRDGVFNTRTPRTELLFINREEAAIKEAADRQNAETLANPDKPELRHPTVVEVQGHLAVATTVGMDSEYFN